MGGRARPLGWTPPDALGQGTELSSCLRSVVQSTLGCFLGIPSAALPPEAEATRKAWSPPSLG